MTDFKGLNGVNITKIVKVNTIDLTSISSINGLDLPETLSIGRGVFGGGYTGTQRLDVIEYISIDTLGNASDFGDLTLARNNGAAASNGATGRAIFCGGSTGSVTDTIDYITIPTLGNALDFGNLSIGINGSDVSSNAENDRAVVFLGLNSSSSPLNIMEYVTISTTSDSADFGDMTSAYYNPAGTSNGTNERGISMGGNTSATTATSFIAYFTINTLGNASSFGYLTIPRGNGSACSNRTNERGVMFGGLYGSSRKPNIDYITINTTGNASDFGNLYVAMNGSAACSNGLDERGITAGGYTYNGIKEDRIDYITINSASNVTYFGDLITGKYAFKGASDV